jgi:phosphomannomutase
MNRVVVGQAAAALATYLLDHGMADGKVIIGFDARRNSDLFARDTAEIMAGAGFEAMITPRPLPTPVVAFGIRHFGCVAGIVVTASHNPPQDNGYKVYLGDGSQIVPPADAEISARIDEVAQHSLDDVPRSPSYDVITPELVDAYVDRIASSVPAAVSRQLRWVYTPLHGVGGSLVQRVVEACGFLPPRSSPSRPSPIHSSQPWPFRTQRSPAQSIWLSRRRGRPRLTW